MNTGKKETEEKCRVSVSRVETQRSEVAEADILARLPVVPFRLDLAGSTALSKRPAAEISRSNNTQTAAVPRVRIRLDEGSVKVNGRKVSIPLGLTGPMTGKSFKELASIYKGDILYIRQPGGLRRISDAETVEVLPNANFTHNRPAPKVSSRPSYGID